MSDKSFAYYGSADLDDGTSVLVDFEVHGWADKEILARTIKWTLFPKDGYTTTNGVRFPFVVVNIPTETTEDGKVVPIAKPVFKSRWYGTIGRDGADLGGFRCYAVGYKKGGTTHWTWVMPDGSMEMETDAPMLADLLWKAKYGGGE